MLVKITLSEATLNRLFTVSDLLDMDVERLLNKMLDDTEEGIINGNDGRSYLRIVNDCVQ